MSATSVTFPGQAPPRPMPRRLLPFRCEAGSARGYPIETLFYEDDTAFPDQSIRRVMMQQAGDTPIGRAIIAMMKMYFDLEGMVDGIVKDREELTIEVGKLRAQLANQRMAERGERTRAAGMEKKKEREGNGGT